MAMVVPAINIGRLVFLVGTGFAGSIALRNGERLSDFLREVQEILQRDRGGGGGGGGADNAQLKAIEGLAREIKELMSISPTIIYQNEDGSRVMTALMGPAAAAGAVGYAYMWWKGITFSSIMYVTKQNMASAVSSMTKHLEQVQNSLAAAKRHLTQRIQKVDDKLDKQKEISEQIRDEVTGARLKLKDIGSEMENLKKLAFNLDGKLDTIQHKQDFQLAGVSYLLQFIEPHGMLPEGSIQFIKQDCGRLPLFLQEGPKGPVVTRSGKKGELPGLGFGLRLLALEQSANRAPSMPVNPAC
ncbi:uncharacterized protein LOC104582510 isoform X2 [Brachypodium distachyon]|uniref:DUF1664 domain-containing protein n=1 Tax=Brachypodium distachyon TaxID=15368 RepID=A0A2K2D748_BRADI|nr:uncharacterized protein LOC104582510 isoform X2 [Brachypodium distachyon]PNT70102.1 hypothetical protein BRADI_2g05455v3 [Brachypodium distachyon]|eukprot:XP_014755117.1 uncharacterized protein LOC104582510 isoform X2 [Brachypodium distachyon]